MRMRLLTFTVAFLAAGMLRAEARTWTSTGGQTVEAELTGRDGDFIILGRANGSQIKIALQDLSSADQAFLAPGDPTAPSAAPSSPAEPAPVAGPIAFQPPPARTTDQIPGVEPLVPASAGYLGLQFGPSPDEVLYIVFDAVDDTELPEQIYLYIPHHPIYGTPTRRAGRRGKYEDQRIMRFTQIEIGANFGAVRATYEIEFQVGIERADVVAMVAEVRLLDAGKLTRLLLGGYINERIHLGPGEIPVLRALDKPALQARVRTATLQPTVSPKLQMGAFNVRPPGKRIVMTVTSDAGKVAERLKHEVTEEELLSFAHGGPYIRLTDVKAATSYTLEASADLGPSLGTVTTRVPFTTRSDGS